MTFHFNQIFFLGIVIAAMVLPQEPISGAPITTQSDSPPPDCNGLKCSLGNKFCDLCCTGQGHKSGSCVKPDFYYVCQCQN
ncbi:hypothetical protein PHAVU_003G015200 [Phaseolus vulgaris]|uniref:Uncharacterized protein n=1 Tax=Phaseolus vulgaris TaxID=3885 RepID=V7C4V6_PHAVU|nr:hypothetical protein PHAVU_003G015200g [Phaseolus vulgaris]ESW25192.1 hypothetical protein PHAVU_003G015200g [Phaseolus vulgaris]